MNAPANHSISTQSQWSLYASFTPSLLQGGNRKVATDVFPKVQMRKIFLNLWFTKNNPTNIVLSEGCIFKHFLFEVGLSLKPYGKTTVCLYPLISQTFLIIILLLFFNSLMSFLHSLVYSQICASIKKTGGTQGNWSEINVFFLAKPMRYSLLQNLFTSKRNMCSF